jgi:biopolymer transport protein ExbB/TolQ
MQERSIFERVTTWVGSPSSFILHTVAFILAFVVGILGLASWTIVLLVLTTVVSLEAIYLSIFIQMTVNRHAEELADVSEDVEDIQEDIEEISEDVDEIQEDIDEIQEDVDEIQEDVEEISEEGGQEEVERKRLQAVTLETLSRDVQRLLQDLEALKRK